MKDDDRTWKYRCIYSEYSGIEYQLVLDDCWNWQIFQLSAGFVQFAGMVPVYSLQNHPYLKIPGSDQFGILGGIDYFTGS